MEKLEISREREMEGKLKKGFWKPEEDLILKKYVESNGEGNWSVVSKKSGLMRGAKSCRLRWKNYLRPNIKRGTMSEDEKDLIIRLHKLLGNRWSLIAGRLPGRTDNEVKNYWNTHLNKRPSRAQIQETPVKEDSLATATTGAAAAAGGTKPQGENIESNTSGADCWIETLKDGDYYGMNMHPDYETYNYMPIFDDLVYSTTSFECAATTTTTSISMEETIFNFCSLIN